MSPKIYVLTLVAGRPSGGPVEFEIAASTVLITKDTDAEVQEAARRQMQEKFPSSQGWKAHGVSLNPLPPVIEDENYRITITAEKLS